MTDVWNSIEVNRKKILEFGAVIFIIVGLIIPLIGFYLSNYSFNPSAKKFFFGSFAFLLSCAFAQKLVEPIYRAWMLLALALGFVMTRVIITIVYFLLITPIGLIRRLSGSDTPKMIRATKAAKLDLPSYWIQKNTKYEKSSTERQF